jgi:ornithine cyclodeaminase/alanine dehydrogenase-like protein (mu-crystallin family)
MRYLAASDLANLLAPDEIIFALEQSLRDFALGQVNIPDRQKIQFPGGTLLSMPVTGPRSLGAKIVSVVPGNSERGLPLINGLMMLADVASGQPQAIFDAAMLTAQRTGAIGAISLKHTTPEDVSTLGIIGTGVQGAWQAIFACAVRRVTNIYFLARSNEKARSFENAVTSRVPRVRCHRCADTDQLLAASEVIIAATTSSEPVLPEEPTRLERKHYLSVGSFRPAMQELPTAVYRLAETVVVDSDAARHEVGDLQAPLRAGAIRVENLVHLADLVTGRRVIDLRKTTAVKSVGLALYDLYAAEAFYARARSAGRGVFLQEEFDGVTRYG